MKSFKLHLTLVVLVICAVAFGDTVVVKTFDAIGVRNGSVNTITLTGSSGVVSATSYLGAWNGTAIPPNKGGIGSPATTPLEGYVLKWVSGSPDWASAGAGHTQNTDVGTNQATWTQGIGGDAFDTNYTHYWGEEHSGTGGRAFLKWSKEDGGNNRHEFSHAVYSPIGFVGPASGLTGIPAGQLTGTASAIDGSLITALNASNLASGTIPGARFPATYPAGSGVNLTALNASNLASGTIPGARFPATYPAGNGSLITALNGSAISSGIIANARLTAAAQEAIALAHAQNTDTGTNSDGFQIGDGLDKDTADIFLFFAQGPPEETPLLKWNYLDQRFQFSDELYGGNITDLNATELTAGTVAEGLLPTGINANKIADGSVSSAEYQYINTLSSNAQTQLNGKAGLAAANTFTLANEFQSDVKVGTDRIIVAPLLDIYDSDIGILRFGKDASVVIFDGTELGMYWSNFDVGLGELEFRTSGGSYYPIHAGEVRASDFTASSGISSPQVLAGGVNISGGKVTQYNSIATEGYGVAAITDVVSLTGRTSDLSATNYTNAGTAGLYRISYSLQDTTADGAAGILTLTIAYTDGSGARTSTATQTMATAGSTQGTVFVQLASGNITYAVTHSGSYGTAVYALHTTCERLN